MTLNEWLRGRALSPAKFAGLIGTSGEAVRRYARAGRIPGPRIMERIVKVTGGEVQPNDFYGLETAPAPPAPAETGASA